MLITAGHFWLHSPHRFNAGGNGLAYLHGNTTFRLGDSRYNNSAAFGKLAAIPQGGSNRTAWVLPRKAGGMSSHNETQGVATGALAMASGINIIGLAEGTTPTAEATLQLVVSMLASADGLSTVEGSINAALGMEGSSAGTSTVDALINALAWAIGQADGTSTAQLVSYATGRLVGEVTPFTELSPEGLASAVWNSLVSAYGEDGTMGNALGLASSGGVDYATLADAILAAAQITPIHSNIKQVNSVTVSGTGVTGNEWGPV